MTQTPVDLAQFSWFNPPERVETIPGGIKIATLPETDFWQRTHYGFRRNDGHALMTGLREDFSFSVRTEFRYKEQYDQCGLFLYLDENNWAKASIEYENAVFGQLGSVVTTNGWSDWAVASISSEVVRMSYRISRRGPDFLFECSAAGDEYHPLRVFHAHGDLSNARVGIYACSPSNSSFEACFTEAAFSPSAWE